MITDDDLNLDCLFQPPNIEDNKEKQNIFNTDFNFSVFNNHQNYPLMNNYDNMDNNFFADNFRFESQFKDG